MENIILKTRIVTARNSGKSGRPHFQRFGRSKIRNVLIKSGRLASMLAVSSRYWPPPQASPIMLRVLNFRSYRPSGPIQLLSLNIDQNN